MAAGHERTLKKRLKQHGWTFLRRGKGSHDIYRHEEHGQMTVAFNVSGRALQNLYKDIERGPIGGGQETDAPPALAPPAPLSIYEPQLGSDLADQLDITYSGLQWRWKFATVVDGLRVARVLSKDHDVPVPKGTRFLFFMVKDDLSDPDQPAESADAAVSAAEELLDEASQRNAELLETNAQLLTRISEWEGRHKANRKRISELEDAASNVKTMRLEVKAQRAKVADLEAALDTAQQQLAIQHQELETDWQGPERAELAVLRAEVANTRPKIVELEAKLEAIDGAGHAPLYIDMAVRDLALAEDHEILAKVSNLRRLLLKQQFEKST
jgi:predicted RNA binding protein YcfA (HicA-like mRNA interferase family)